MVAALQITALLVCACLSCSSAEHPLPATVARDATLEEVYSEKLFFEGPAWDRAGKKLFFTAFKKDNQQILRLDEKGKATVWLDKTEGVNGQRVSKDGRLISAQAYGHRVMCYTFGENGPGETKVLLENKELNQPNDVWIAPDGTIYFTDPDFKEKKKSAVWRLKTDGSAEKLPITMTLPNGLAVSPDGKTLYVADSFEKLWRAFPIEADGKIGAGKVLFNPETDSKADPDGMTLDENGNIYATGRGGVWVFTPKGEELGFIPCPAFASNVTFGGEDGKTLLITGSNKVWSLRMTVRGIESRER